MEATTDNEAAGPTGVSGTGWIEFSERHARASSSDFARSVVQYFNSTLPEGARNQISHKDLLKRFIECFSENFEHEYFRRSVQQGKVSKSIIKTHETKKCFFFFRSKSHGWATKMMVKK